LSLKRIPEHPILCLITEGILTDESFGHASASLFDTINAAVHHKIPIVQIREKGISAKHLFNLTSRAVEIARNSATHIIVNDRADIAAAAGADGVQLTEVSLPAEVVRQAFADLVIGVSTHSVSSIIAAANNGADFALFGPVFATPGKERTQGLDALADACRAVVGFPVLAVGGVNRSNSQLVLNAGCAGFAAIRYLNDISELSEAGLT
jgi:thiamine-phosphate diphosphorylase